MAPLAGRPPFATDEPDSFYETPHAAQPRLRQPPPADPNKRSSAYDVYDNYLQGDKSKLEAPAAPSSRNSGIGAMLLSMDDSDSDDDDEDYRRRPANPPGISPILSKNAALAAATSPASTRPSPPPQSQQQQPAAQTVQLNAQQSPQQQPIMRGSAPPAQQQQQQQMGQPAQQQMRMPTSPPPMHNQQHQQPIAAPRPGYPAPIAALNLARPDVAAAPGGRQPVQQHPPPMQMPQPMQQKGGLPPIRIPNPFDPPRPNAGYAGPIPGSPAPSTPHPLLPPVTPITPAFIRPSKSPAPGSVVTVSFEEGVARPRKPIMRGNSEETLLPSRGEKGDDFWRRFSMVVKEENMKPNALKESSWLRKTQSGGTRLSRWVWIVGMFLLICVAGGIGCGIYISRNSPSHQQPTAIGGDADNLATAVSSSTAASVSGAKASTSSSSLHVSPTNTVARRGDAAGDGDAWAYAAQPTPAAGNVSSVKRHVMKKRLNAAVVAW